MLDKTDPEAVKAHLKKNSWYEVEGGWRHPKGKRGNTPYLNDREQWTYPSVERVYDLDEAIVVQEFHEKSDRVRAREAQERREREEKQHAGMTAAKVGA